MPTRPSCGGLKDKLSAYSAEIFEAIRLTSLDRQNANAIVHGCAPDACVYAAIEWGIGDEEHAEQMLSAIGEVAAADCRRAFIILQTFDVPPDSTEAERTEILRQKQDGLNPDCRGLLCLGMDRAGFVMEVSAKFAWVPKMGGGERVYEPTICKPVKDPLMSIGGSAAAFLAAIKFPGV